MVRTKPRERYKNCLCKICMKCGGWVSFFLLQNILLYKMYVVVINFVVTNYYMQKIKVPMLFIWGSFSHFSSALATRSKGGKKYVIGQTWSPPVPTKFSFVTGRCARLVRCPSSVNSFLLVPLFVAELLLRPPVIGLTAKALSQWHSWSPSQVPCWWQAHPLANVSSCDWEFDV